MAQLSLRIIFVLLITIRVDGVFAKSSEVLVDLSANKVKVNSSFVGTNVMVFGTKKPSESIVILIIGPSEKIVVRKKQPLGGIWVNGEKQEFQNVPGFYAIASTQPLNEIIGPHLMKRYEIGIHNLIANRLLRKKPADNKSDKAFKEALIRGKKKQLLFLDEPLKINVISDQLFKTSFHFPSNMTTGDYTVKVFAFQKKKFISMTTKNISVEKTGIGADLFRFAKEQSALYGILAIVIAMLSGWIAAVIFRKI